MKEKLKALLGKLVCIMNERGQVAFGHLETNGELFGVQNNGFKLEMVKEIVPIEVEETKNAARAVIKV